jgi:hypothetical protein
MRCIVDWKPIANGLQHSAQQAERPMPVVPAKPRVEIIDPLVRELNGGIDAFKTHIAHDKSCMAAFDGASLISCWSEVVEDFAPDQQSSILQCWAAVSESA